MTGFFSFPFDFHESFALLRDLLVLTSLVRLFPEYFSIISNSFRTFAFLPKRRRMNGLLVQFYFGFTMKSTMAATPLDHETGDCQCVEAFPVQVSCEFCGNQARATGSRNDPFCPILQAIRTDSSKHFTFLMV